jgi:drug/metabolite transporter (DMT)-like permease
MVPARPARGRAAGVVVALLIVYVVWGSTYLGIALAIETLPPLLMAGARFLVAGALLYVVARRLTPGAAADRRQWLAAGVTGLLMLGVGNGGVSWAEQRVPSGIAALVIATIPLWIVVLDRLAFGARLSGRAAVGVAIGFAGTALLIDPRGPGGIDVVGAVVLLAAAAAWATGTLLSRGQTLTVSPFVGAGMQMLCGGAALVVAGVVGGELDEVHLGAVSARSGLALAYLVVFGSLVAFSAYVWLLRNASTPLVATYAYVNPVVAVALGWAVLDETVGPRTLVAGAVIIGAVALIVSAPGRRPQARTESVSDSQGCSSRTKAGSIAWGSGDSR